MQIFSLLQKRYLKSLMYDLQPTTCLSWNSWNLYLTLHKDSLLYKSTTMKKTEGHRKTLWRPNCETTSTTTFLSMKISFLSRPPILLDSYSIKGLARKRADYLLWPPLFLVVTLAEDQLESNTTKNSTLMALVRIWIISISQLGYLAWPPTKHIPCSVVNNPLQL